jgi:Spy/CpxP family protein refolding chaperone
VFYKVIIPGREKTGRKDVRRGKGKAGRQDKAGATATSNLSSTLSAAAICPASFQKEDKMKGKLIFKLGALSTILSFLLVIPALGQTDVELGKQLKEYKAQTFDQLKFNPNQKKTLLAVEDKYSSMRGEIVDSSKKAWDDLQAALAAASPDEAKVKGLVKSYMAAQTKMFSSFRDEMDEELAQMSPVQQGKYLVAMEAWRQKCMPKVCTPITK